MEAMSMKYSDVLDNLYFNHSEIGREEILHFCNDFSYKVFSDKTGVDTIYPYERNKNEYLKLYAGADIEAVTQRYCCKKIKRLQQRLQEGRCIFLRIYCKNTENIDDFRYFQIGKIRRSRLGIWRLYFVNRSRPSSLHNLRSMSKSAFHKFDDWSVYEDISFLKPEKPIKLSRVKAIYNNFILCKAARRTVNRYELEGKDSQLQVSGEFLKQRKEAYGLLNKTFDYCEDDRKSLQESLNSLNSGALSRNEFKQWIADERSIITGLVENIN